MQVIRELSEAASNLIKRVTEESRAIVALNVLPGERQMLEAQSTFSPLEHFDSQLILIEEGIATVTVSGRSLLVLEEGDLFALPVDRIVPELQLETDFAVSVTLFSMEKVQEAVSAGGVLARHWEDIQTLRHALFMMLYTEHCATNETVFPSIRNYESGAVIIEEGDAAAEVYTLIEGAAEVFHCGILVGTVDEDEIFGALAALTDTRRTASVVAARRCTVAVLPADSFRSLIQSRPHTVEKLIRDFARKIVQLNTRLVEK